MTSIQMPQLGETIVEGTILKWLKQEGERIEIDEPLFELSTDKVDTEVPSPVSGTVTKILVAEGTTVAVGTALAEVDSGDGAASGNGDGASGATAPDPSAAAPGAVAADAADADDASPPPSPAAASDLGRPRTGRSLAASLPDRGPRSQILSPLVRKLAEEHQLDLSQVSGSGTGGRITKKDVMDAVAAGGTSAPAAAAAAPAARRRPRCAPCRGRPWPAAAKRSCR